VDEGNPAREVSARPRLFVLLSRE